MDQSYSDSDISLSPSKIFERLQMLRQLQIMQRGKLKKHYSEHQDSPEISSSVTEIVSHFSNSTSYNTFRSLLQSSQEINTEDNSIKADESSRKEIQQDYIEGVSALNLSQESEFITNSPVSSRSVSSKVSTTAMVHATDIITIEKSSNSAPAHMRQINSTAKQIALDEMPILSPKKNFEELVVEKLKNENTKSKSPKSIKQNPSKGKKPFLRRGEGMARFGLRKNDLVIQNTKALPWRKPTTFVKPLKQQLDSREERKSKKKEKPVHVQIVEPKPKEISLIEQNKECYVKEMEACNKLPRTNQQISNENSNSCIANLSEVNDQPIKNKPSLKVQGPSNGKHPVKTAKGQTWASVLTKEQDMFLRQLKQSDYYKNFVSPAKSTVSDTSCNGTPLTLRQERERAEQNMFEFLENKVIHESFNLNNSFFNRFLRKNLECSGESTPIVLQKCLYENPGLLHLHCEESKRNRNISCCDGETCSVLTEGSETCSSVSTCCSCKQDDPSNVNQAQYNKEETIESCHKNNERKEEKSQLESKNCPNDTVKTNDGINSDMAEMNAKLIATSELLKDRLRELEDEIETFRKENINLTKMREELDLERQKFYEEKTIFEQKFNEEKILSEYYLAEEKEKLNKQKQTYDRYVREMRGRLSKKEKEEVSNLKREITELKDEIRNKDAKSTATIARLRNQIKIVEKERKTLQDEIEKLKKENRRIQHSNDITRRLTNLKYLEQINKKLNNMSSKNGHSETDISDNQKFKAFEIEKQSRIKKPPPVSIRRRTKSVPNLNVTSRYAKYFSKKDFASDKESDELRDKKLVIDNESDTEELHNENEDFYDSNLSNENDSGEENNLEKMYNERFQSFSPPDKHDHTRNAQHTNKHNTNDGFFIQRTNSSSRSLDHSSKTSLSPYQSNSIEASLNASRSPVSIPSYRSHRSSNSPINGVNLPEQYKSAINHPNNQCVDTRPKSSVSILSNRVSGDQRTASINKDLYSDKRMIPSPEPMSSRSSALKTNLNPTEIKKPDGSKELRFPNGNVKHISKDGRYSKFVYYNGDIKENFYDEGRIKYFYAETKTYHTTHADGLEVLEFSDGQIEKRYKDGSSEIRLPNGSVRYYDPKNEHVREEWRFPDGAALTVSATGEQRIVFPNGQVEVHAKDHKRREFPDGTVKLVYNDGTSETRYASGRVRIKDKHGNLIMDSAPG